MMLPGGAWFMSDATAAPVYGDSFVMSPSSTAQTQTPQQQLQRHSPQALVLQRSTPRGVALRKPEPPTEIIPLPLDEVEVSIVVLPVEEKSLDIVPFKQMLRESRDSWGPLQDTAEQQQQGLGCPASSSSDGSSCLAIVPRDGSTMLGVVLGSAVRRRDDDLTLPVVSLRWFWFLWLLSCVCDMLRVLSTIVSCLCSCLMLPDVLGAELDSHTCLCVVLPGDCAV
jgi:hypothetical protein